MEPKKPLAETFKRIGSDNPLTGVFSSVGKSILGIKKSMTTLVNVAKKEVDLDKKERKLDLDILRAKQERNKRFSLNIGKKLKDITKKAAASVKDAIGNILKIFLAYKFFEIVKNIYENWKAIAKWWKDVQDGFKKFSDDVNGIIGKFTQAYDDVASFVEEVIKNIRGLIPGAKTEQTSTNTTQPPTESESQTPSKTDSNLTPKSLPKMTNADIKKYNQNTGSGGFDIGFINTKSPLLNFVDSFKEVQSTEEKLVKEPENPNLKKLLKDSKEKLEKHSKILKDLKLKYPKSDLDSFEKTNGKKMTSSLRGLVTEAQDFKKKQDGGIMMPGGGSVTTGATVGDSVPALLEKGEYVLNRKAVQRIGIDKLNEWNFKNVPRFQAGGIVAGYSGDSGRSSAPHIHLQQGFGGRGVNYDASYLDNYVRVGGKPIKSYHQTSEVGEMRGSHRHAGKDFGVPTGQKIELFNGARVIRKDVDPGGYGNYIIVRTPDGRDWTFGHLSRFGNAKVEQEGPKSSDIASTPDTTTPDSPGGIMSGMGQMTGFMQDLWNSITSGLSAAGLDLGAIADAFGGAADGLTGGDSPIGQITNIFSGGLKPNKESKMKPANTTSLVSSISGLVPGAGSGDIVPAKLEPGEFVMNKDAVAAVGAENLKSFNSDYVSDGSGRRQMVENMKISSITNTGVDIQTLPMPKLNIPTAPKAAASAVSERPLPNLSAFPPSRVMSVLAFRFPGSTYDLVG